MCMLRACAFPLSACAADETEQNSEQRPTAYKWCSCWRSELIRVCMHHAHAQFPWYNTNGTHTSEALLVHVSSQSMIWVSLGRAIFHREREIGFNLWNAIVIIPFIFVRICLYLDLHCVRCSCFSLFPDFSCLLLPCLSTGRNYYHRKVFSHQPHCIEAHTWKTNRCDDELIDIHAIRNEAYGFNFIIMRRNFAAFHAEYVKCARVSRLVYVCTKQIIYRFGYTPSNARRQWIGAGDDCHHKNG